MNRSTGRRSPGNSRRIGIQTRLSRGVRSLSGRTRNAIRNFYPHSRNWNTPIRSKTLRPR